MLTLLHLNIVAMFCISVTCKTIEGPERRVGQCKGTIRLISPCGLIQDYRKDVAHINFKAAKAVLEGCGCYRLHERKNYRGRTFTVDTQGEHKVLLRRVRSVAKVSCSRATLSKRMLPVDAYVSVVIHHKKSHKRRRHSKKKKSMNIRKYLQVFDSKTS